MDEDDDWDLHAVVRGCAPAPAAAAAANNHPFPHLHSSFPYHDDQKSFDFPGLVDDGRNDPFQDLLEINQDFCFDDPPPTSAAGIMTAPPPLVLQPHQHIMQVRPPLPIQENVQFNISPTLGQNSIPQPIRPRRRKNQQIMKLVRQMTQEELSADSWAWRKYGQKPIKGSPYPRNYYRCSTSKGCSARKQVERSPNDPEVFVVSYSGEHTHPRPTHRSSLAGSTRSKFASPPPKGGGSGAINTIISQKGPMSSSSSSSPAAGSSFSPATPSMEAEAAAQNDDVNMAEEVDEDDDNVIMIPNDLMNDDDDIFRAFQDSDDHSSGGGCDFFSYGLVSSPPWTPTSSAGNASTLHGGGS